MKWSISKSGIFRQCPRKWYFSDIVAHWGPKNPERREAYLLNQLSSAYAWRGNVVDLTISKFVMPGINAGSMPSEQQTIAYAMKLMNDQLAFARSKKHLEPGMTKTAAGVAFCALYELEYGDGIGDAKVNELRDEVRTSLIHLYQSDLLKDICSNSLYIVPQRSIAFPFDGVTVTATPDIIVFFSDRSPLIVDWKVHGAALKEYWLQLGIYAVTLSKATPHKDYAQYLTHLEAKDVTLIEFQLLNNQERRYTLTDDDLVEIEDYIFSSSTQIRRYVNGGTYRTLNPDQFPTAQSPSTCKRCNFKKICWEPAEVCNGTDRIQYLFD